uniref:MI domain-containing protein n=1 Tax=Arcella intermedia TaxID=1963864 RepID=A0A6B2KXV4_9EUKA
MAKKKEQQKPAKKVFVPPPLIREDPEAAKEDTKTIKEMEKKLFFGRKPGDRIGGGFDVLFQDSDDEAEGSDGAPAKELTMGEGSEEDKGSDESEEEGANEAPDEAGNVAGDVDEEEEEDGDEDGGEEENGKAVEEVKNEEGGDDEDEEEAEATKGDAIEAQEEENIKGDQIADQEEEIEPKELPKPLKEAPQENQTPGMKYVPPHLRKNDNQKILREVRGKLNKLSESNFLSMADEIESLFHKYTHHAVTENLISAIIGNLGDAQLQISSFVLTYAALVTFLHAKIGVEIGGKFLDDVSRKFNTNYVEEVKKDNLSEVTRNYLLFLLQLYNFKVLHCRLVFDLIKVFVESFSSVDIELLLLLVKTCGIQLRSDDPSALKEIISLVFERAGQVGISINTKTKAPIIQGKVEPEKKGFTKRIEFMLEMIVNLKNNKLANDNESTLRMKKLLDVHFDRKKLTVDEINIPWEDLISKERKGRFWLVGSGWAAPTAREQQEKRELLKNLGEFDDEIVKLAKLHRMTTDSRRSIFGVLVTSEDYMDAFEKLLRLNLKSKQDREIVSILLYCSHQEKTYNPYYSHLAEKLGTFNKNYIFTFKIAFWDIIKCLHDPNDSKNSEYTPQKIKNLASLLGDLIGSGLMPLVIFKPLNILDASPKEILFFRLVFDRLFQERSEAELIEIFHGKMEGMNQKTIKEELKEQLVAFLSQYIKNKKAKSEDTSQQIITNAKLAKKIMKQIKL